MKTRNIPSSPVNRPLRVAFLIDTGVLGGRTDELNDLIDEIIGYNNTIGEAAQTRSCSFREKIYSLMPGVCSSWLTLIASRLSRLWNPV
jgi:hypothetical protein